MSRALVVSGGGSKGAFAVGAIKELISMFPRLDFDIYVGTSAGAIVISLASIKEFELLEHIYTTLTTEDVLTRFNVVDRINENSVFDVTPAWKLITTYYPDAKYETLLQSGKKVFITTTCLQNSELTVFSNEARSVNPTNYTVFQLINADHYRKALLASACEPVFMPPVKVNLNVPGNLHPNYQFVDGGIMKYVGVQTAIDAGATEVFTIILSPEKTQAIDTEFHSLLPILQQTIDIFITDVGKNDLQIPKQYNEALQYIDAVKKKMQEAGIPQSQVNEYFRINGPGNIYENRSPFKIFIIRPDAFLGGGPGGLEFNPAEMQQMLAKGQQATREFIASLDPDDITWD